MHTPNELLHSAQDLNAGAMFGELAGEPNSEALARPNLREEMRGAA